MFDKFDIRGGNLFVYLINKLFIFLYIIYISVCVVVFVPY